MKKAFQHIICCCCAAWLLLQASCTADTSMANDDTPGNNLHAPAVSGEVATASVTRRPFQYLIHTNGKIRASAEQMMITVNSGVVEVCHARTGKFVQKGELVLQFASATSRFKLKRATLAKFSGEKEYESQLLGYEQLLAHKSEAEVAAIRQKLRISSGLAVAEQEISEAEYELAQAELKAPISGILADVKVQQGALLKPGQELFRIYDPSSLLTEVKILEADVALLRTQMKATVRVIADPSRQYGATVFEINPYVDENGMVTVTLRINEPRSLFPGMNCTAVIMAPATNALVIPKEALIMRNNKAVVFTLEQGRAKWNYVKTGRDNGKELEVLEGLTAGQKVITSNNLQLVHDTPVKEKQGI